MMLPPPKVDTRTADDIVKWIKQQEKFNELQNDQLSEALVRIFARYCEIIIERLNQVPEKNYRVFLNELGISRNPPIAAQAPLTFTLVKNAALPAPIVVPRHTRVAAAPGNGENSPVTFETNQALTVTQAELVKIAAIDTYEDCYSDVSYLTSLNHEIDNIFPFKGTLPIRHELYIGVKNAIAENTVSNLQLVFSIPKQKSIFLDCQLEWRIQSDSGELLITAENDTTDGLRQSGIISFKNLPKWQRSRKGGRNGYWLICRLVNSIQPAERNELNIIKDLPTINRIEITGYTYLAETQLDCAFINTVPIDLSKDFFPLGSIPHFGDVFYISSPGFANLEANVTLNIILTNSASNEKESPIPRVNQTGQATIQWEFWNGSYWDDLDCNDNTQALTEDGKVSFAIPAVFKETAVNGLKGYWIRARLVAGHYGFQERIEYGNQKEQGQNIKFIPSTLAPPSMAAIKISTIKKFEPSKPVAVITDNDFVISHFDIEKNRTLKPFQINQEPIRALYFVFKAADKAMLAGYGLDLYFKINHVAERIVYRGDQQYPVLNWQYWNGSSWEMCKIRYDETQSFNVSGVVSLFIPDDIASWGETDSSLVEGVISQDQFVVDDEQTKLSQIEMKPVTYGIRVVWVTGDYHYGPVLQRVLLNTVLAEQVLTLEGEILGSSNGIPNQVFFSARTPILDNFILEVKEPHLPSSTEMNEYENAPTNTTAKDSKAGVWVRWHEVNDFLESGHSDRHFVVDRISGQIHFGNGDKGMQPPVGANNIRLRIYKTGGGSQGNKPANSITQLHTALPLIAAVTNHESAKGGQNIEDWDSVFERGPTYLRHRGRAVTARDFEDLAKISSPLVAKAKCFPLKDLGADFPLTGKPGDVSLVVVPRITDPEPRPSLDLLRHVWEFINPLRMQGTSLVLVGPDCLYINIQADIVPKYDSIEMDVVTVCRERLEAFLHPLTGGENTHGWDIGKRPHESDVYAVLESLPHLEFVRSLQVTFHEERTGILESGNFLVCSGKHKITLCQ